MNAPANPLIPTAELPRFSDIRPEQIAPALDEAIAQYTEALRLDPNFAEAHNNLGVALRDRGKLDRAIAHYQQALRLNPDFAAAHYNLGIVLKALGRLDEAIKEYREATGASLKTSKDAIEAWMKSEKIAGSAGPGCGTSVLLLLLLGIGYLLTSRQRARDELGRMRSRAETAPRSGEEP